MRDAMWCTGPAGDRARYRVGEPSPLPGGQNYVFEAEGPDGRVALKLIESASAADEEKQRDRAARLAEHPHPRVRRPTEIFRAPGLHRGDPPPDDECDLLAIASPWVEGCTLRSAAAISPQAAMTVLDDVVDAVQHLHEVCGFVHRDLHPGNVLVDADGRATVIDLGAAREDDGGDTTTIAGVLGFIAPERTHSVGDRRTDRWGVGMLAVCALVGHPQGDRSPAQLEAELRQALADTGNPARAAAPVSPVVAAAAAGVVVFGGDDGAADDDESTALRTDTENGALLTPASCGQGFGDPGEGVDPAAVSAVVDELIAASEGGCAIGPVEQFGDALIQPVGINGPDGVVVASPEGGAVRLTEAQYNSWRQMAGNDDQQNAIRFGGYPTDVVVDDIPGAIVVRLSGNGALVGTRSDTQAFWVPDQVREVWDANGGADGPLGLPMTSVFLAVDGLRQEFAGGYVVAPGTDRPAEETTAADLQVVLVQDRASVLRDLGDISGRIVRQTTGTAWLVGPGGTRHWIADGGTWECLGGDANVVIHDAPGHAVATLPLGPPAECQ